jgi:hypothetical protein
MAMMPPTIVVAAASAPTVLMTTTAASRMAVTMTVAVAALDLDDSSIGAAESTRCCGGPAPGRFAAYRRTAIFGWGTKNKSTVAGTFIG